MLIHGFMDTWRTWQLVLGALERRHDVLAPTLPGHTGGPPLPPRLTGAQLADAVEAAMDAAGFGTAHVAGNSLGGYVALQLAERGRARSVVALAPAGGWADDAYRELLNEQAALHEQLRGAGAHADAIAATPQGRRRATALLTTNYEHLPAAVVADLIRDTAGCPGAQRMIAYALEHGYPLDFERITCPVRIVWGTADRLLPWPGAAARFERNLNADWVVLDGIGHCPQLDVPLETAQLILGYAILA